MLSDSEIKKAITEGFFTVISKTGKVKTTAQKLDDDNLWLEILASGPAEARTRKGFWRFRFIRPANGQATRMALGEYPYTSLKVARNKARDARTLLGSSPPIDPITHKAKAKDAARKRRTFEQVIREWFTAFRESDMTRSKRTRERDLTSRDQLIGLVGKMMIDEITTTDVQNVLIAIANVDGHKPKARQLRGVMGEVFKYAIAQKERTTNPAAGDLFNLPTVKTKQLPAIVSPREIGEMLRRIDAYDGRVFTRAALEVMARSVPRPANIAAMRFDEIIDGVWIIPAHKMKMRKMHRVPLSRQVLAIIAEMRKLTNGDYVFSSGNKPMGKKTLNRALATLGYGGKHCAHGFRSTFSTLLRAEARWPVDIIELQLAHGDADKVAEAYNRTAQLDAILAEHPTDIANRLWQVREKMMQHWSDRLDALRDDTTAIASNVVPLHKAA